MVFWSSSEATSEANEQFRPIRKVVESEMNRLLEKISLGTEWEGWKWAFIAIIVSREFDQDYTERARRSAKDRVLEFRLTLNHDLFVKSSFIDQLSQYFGQLRRSVEMMGKWKMSSKDRSTLLDTLKDAQTALVQRDSGGY